MKRKTLTFLISLVIGCTVTQKPVKSPKPEDIKQELSTKLELQLGQDKDCASKNKTLLKAYVDKTDEYYKLWMDYVQVKSENASLNQQLKTYADLSGKIQPKKVVIKSSNNEKTILTNSIQQKDIENSQLRNDSITLANKIKIISEENLKLRKSLNSAPLKNLNKTVHKSPFIAWIVVILVCITLGFILGRVSKNYKWLAFLGL